MKDEPVPDVVPNPAPHFQQPMHAQSLQQPMHHMQELSPGASMHPGLGGAPIANMGVMQGSMPGQPVNMMGPSGLREEIIDEIKDEV